MWFGNVIIREAGKTPDQASKILKIWIENGLLKNVEHYSNTRKRTILKLVLDRAKADELLANLRMSAPSN